MKIYIYNVPAYSTGGVESLYQFCDMLNNLGYEAYIVYLTNVENPLPDRYAKYNLRFASEIEDVFGNVIVVAEVWPEKLPTIKHAQKCFWWLSVDNNQKRFQQFDDESIIHLYQSTYARLLLEANSVKHKLSVPDYVYAKPCKVLPKLDIVAYNPVKGFHTTQAIIASCPGVKFVPLANMTESELMDTLTRSKIYIDFGNHPGKDRIPREAALCNNIVITGRAGSAGNQEDIPILDCYKLDSPGAAANLIVECLRNYDSKINDFSSYREEIHNQREELRKATLLFLSSVEVIILEQVVRNHSCDLGENWKKLHSFVKDYSHGTFVDLGVHRGSSSATLLYEAHKNKNHVFGVDIDHSLLLPIVRNNPNYTSLVGDSVTIGKYFSDKVTGLFVDTFHIKEQVLCELYYWYPKLIEGGFIGFHDTNWPAGKNDNYGSIVWETPDKAILEFFNIPSLNYEDEYIKVENYPESWGMTLVKLKKKKDYISEYKNWSAIFQRRNLLISLFWTKQNKGEMLIDLMLPNES